MSRETRLVLAVLVLVFAPLAAFAPALANGFTRWDDPFYLVENPIVRALSVENLKIIFTATHHGLYKPLTLLSFAIEHRLFGLHPLAYHTTNVALHTLNGLLVLLFVYRLTGGRIAVAFLTALFFSLHPLRVESVAWVAERKDVLYSFFFLAALSAYTAYVRRGDRRWLAGTLFFFAASLLAKPMGITFPVALFLIDAAARRRFVGKLFLEKAPILAFTLAYAALTAASLAVFTGRFVSQHPFASSWRLFVPDLPGAAKCLLLYVQKLALPVKLSCIYPQPAEIDLGPPSFALAAAAAVVFAAVRFREARFGVLFFLVTIFPVLPFIRIFGTVSTPTIADRYTYLPSIGLFYAAAGGAAFLLRRRNRLVRAATAAVLSFSAASLFSLTFARCPVWKNGIDLWNDAIGKYDRVPEAYLNRGVEYHFQGAFEKAEADYRRVLAVSPAHLETRGFLADIHLARGERDDALRLYRGSVGALPAGTAVSAHHRAILHKLAGRTRIAFLAEWKALEFDPGYWPALKQLADWSFAKKDYETARALYELAAAAEPYRFFDFGRLGVAYGVLGRHREAVRALEKANALDPKSAGIMKNLAAAYLKSGETQKALGTLNRLLRMDLAEEDAERVREMISSLRASGGISRGN